MPTSWRTVKKILNWQDKKFDKSDCVSPDDGFVSLVSCNIDPYKDKRAVKKTLTIPAWLNERAVSMGINFSQVLQDALLRKIA